jgi:hypothetical protein
MTPTMQAFRSWSAIESRERPCKAFVRNASGFRRSLGITGMETVGMVRDRGAGLHMGMATVLAPPLMDTVQGRMVVDMEVRLRGIDEG